MNDFLTSLATRALQPSYDVQPRLLSVFEPGQPRGETADIDDGGVPNVSRAPVARNETAFEKTPDTKTGPLSIAARPDQLAAVLTPGANPGMTSNPPSPSVLQPLSFNPRVNRFPRGVSEDRGSPGHGDDDRIGPSAEPRNGWTGSADGLKPGFTPAITAMEPRQGPVMVDTGPAVEIPFRPPPIIPAQAPPIAAPWQPHRESSARHSDPARDFGPRVIQISIGRLEIRAAASSPSTRPRSVDNASQATTLDEYLSRKSAGGGK